MMPFGALRKFFSRDVNAFSPMDDPFIEIDRDAVVKSMKLKERGQEQGELNLPSGSDDVVEAEIVSAIGDHLNRAQIDARNSVQAYEQRISQLQLLHEFGTIHGATLKALGDFTTLVVDWSNRLANRRDSVRESYHELRKFRQDNGLERPVHEVPSKLVPYASIATTWLVEAILNMFFLKVNDELGYLGGAVAALFVAFINVGLGVAVGVILWPRTHLKAHAHRVVAWVGIAFWLIFIVGWNLAAAHFRDAKYEGLTDPQAAAVVSLFANPFGLSGLYSWALFIVGTLAALFAARAGYRTDDPFPGYGDIGQKHRQRCEDYAAEVAEANKQLTLVRNDAIDVAQEVKRELGIQFRERERIEKAYHHFAERYGQYQSHLDQTANYLLSVYRDANRKARTELEPPHFGDRYVLERSTISPLAQAPVSESDVKRAEEALTNSIDRIAAAFNDAIKQFTPLDTLKAELERGAL